MWMWRNLPAPFLFAIANAEEESAYMMPDFNCPQSRNIARTPNMSEVHFTNAINSASAELSVT